MKKNLLFKVTADDCEWEYFRGSGKGGQKRNKTANAVRCKHKASGAVGKAQDERSRKINKRLAFKRMFESKEFQAWLKLEISKVTGVQDRAKAYAEKEINSDRILVEVREKGKWIEENKES